MNRLKKLMLCGVALALTACQGEQVAVGLTPTDTLAPLVTLTPRVTATPIRTQTPLPTFTFTPSITPVPPTPTISPTPTEVPPIIGIIQSLQSVNVREGPGLAFREFVALTPGTGVTVLGRTEDGDWLNVKLEDGREGWVRSTLVRVQPTATPFVIAQIAATADLTALAGGTQLPTAVLGGGTVTPTPGSAATATPPGTAAPTPTLAASITPDLPVVRPTEPGGPVINTTVIAQTAAALASAAATLTPTPGSAAAGTPTAGIFAPGTNAPTLPAGTTGVQVGLDVLAYCDDPFFRLPPPTSLAAGSTIDIFWAWYAQTEAQVRDHIDAAIYDVRINGEPLRNWQNYRTSIRPERGNYYVYWFVPYGPLAAGEYRITYRVSWSRQISDGYASFGPGTSRPSEQGTCTFTVR